MFDNRPPLPQPPQVSLIIVFILAACSGIMLACGVPAMVGSDGVLDWIKCVVIAVGATVANYAVTRLAVEKGAPQAAIGIKGSAVLSLVMLALTGGSTFTGSFGGLTLRQADELRLANHGRELSALIEARGRIAQEAGRAAPVLRSIVDDLGLRARCERDSSCLSGRPGGGTGPVARMVAEKQQRAETVLGQLIEGESVRTSTLAQLNAAMERYQAALIDPQADQAEKRKALHAIADEIGTMLTVLDEAIPSTLLRAYVSELRTPVSIPGQREVSAKLESVLQGYANSLSSSLRSSEPGASQRPVFPSNTGVFDTLGFVGHFIPLAATIAVIELILPVCMWFFAYFAIKAGMDDGSDDPDDLSGLTSGKSMGDAARDLPRRPRPVRSE